MEFNVCDGGSKSISNLYAVQMLCKFHETLNSFHATFCCRK